MPVYLQIGMVYSVQHLNEDICFWWVDLYVYSMLQLYFTPFYMMGKGSETEQWISQFSTNGIKPFNLCRP
jgi:hypothetical protein